MRKLAILGTLGILLFLSGCWDRWEIEERGFVLGLAIDRPPTVEHKEIFQVTMQRAITEAMAGGGGEGGTKPSPGLNISGTGQSLQQVFSLLVDTSNRPPSLEHLKVIIFGEKVARSGVGPLLDFFARNPEVRLGTDMLIAKGDARKVLEIRMETQQPAALAIAESLDNRRYTLTMAPRQNVGQVLHALLEKQGVVVPRVIATGKQFSLRGAALLKEGKLVDWLNGQEVAGYAWLMGRVEGGTVTINEPGHPEHQVSFRITDASVFRRVGLTETGPEVEFRIRTEGDLVEITHVRKHGEDAQVLRRIEEALAEDIRQTCLATAKKMQRHETDALKLCNEVYRRWPQYWQARQKEWPRLFAEMPITVRVEAHIRRSGVRE